MALKVLMLKKSLDEKRSTLNQINDKLAELEKRELDLEKAIEEATTEEEKKVVEENVEAYEKEKEEANEKKSSLEEEIANLENELKEEEKEVEQPEEKQEDVAEPQEERGVKQNMETRTFMRMNAQDTDMFFKREDVKAYLGEVRNAIKEKRALNNVGLTIPEVFLGLIRENIMDYSKLYKHVWVRNVGGTSRATIMSNIPEGVWTDCCANLNELSLTFYEMELDCWKVGKETLNVINA